MLILCSVQKVIKLVRLSKVGNNEMLGSSAMNNGQSMFAMFLIALHAKIITT